MLPLFYRLSTLKAPISIKSVGFYVSDRSVIRTTHVIAGAGVNT